MPALSKDVLASGEFEQTLAWFVGNAEVPEATPAAEQARARLLAMPWPARLTLAESVFDAAYPAEQLGECLYVAAALQLHLTRLAAQLDAARLRPVGNGVCPVCGSGPVASAVVGWANAERARYCCCALCSTLWNYVRIKCTACGSTAGINYLLIAEQSQDTAAETCAGCRSYVKHFHQHRKPEIEPFADDIATFGLDLLVREQGFRRATQNPLMVVAASADVVSACTDGEACTPD
jgi:FdhE protein